jgi:hypothetical protein
MMKKADEVLNLLENNLKIFLLEQGSSSLGEQHTKILSSLLSSVTTCAQDKLNKIYNTDEVNSGDDFFNTSKDTLSLTIIKSCLVDEISKSQKSKDNKKNEAFVLSEDASSSESGNARSAHEKRLNTLLKKIDSLANKKMNTAIKSGEMGSGDKLFNPNSSRFAISIISAAFIESGSGLEQQSESYLWDQLEYETGQSEIITMIEQVMSERSGDELPWEKGARAIKSEVDSRFGKNKPKIRGFLIQVYKHLKDEQKIKTMKQLLDLYKREVGDPKKKVSSKTVEREREAEESHSDKKFMERHPIIGGMLKAAPFSLAAQVGYVAATLGASPIGWPVYVAGSIAAGAISAKSFYAAGKEYGQDTKGAKDQEVGSFRKFYRRHPIVGGILSLNPIGGIAYSMGQKKARKETVEKVL